MCPGNWLSWICRHPVKGHFISLEGGTVVDWLWRWNCDSIRLTAWSCIAEHIQPMEFDYLWPNNTCCPLVSNDKLSHIAWPIAVQPYQTSKLRSFLVVMVPKLYFPPPINTHVQSAPEIIYIAQNCAVWAAQSVQAPLLNLPKICVLCAWTPLLCTEMCPTKSSYIV